MRHTFRNRTAALAALQAAGVALPLAGVAAANAGTANLSYTAAFSGSTLPTGSSVSGTAALVVDRLALVRWGSQGTSGSWDSGSLSLAAGGSITSFNATFDFGFNDNDFSTRTDYLSFRVGGLEVGFSMVSNPGVSASWQGTQQAYQPHSANFLDSAFSLNAGTNWTVGGSAEITWTQGGNLVVNLTLPGFSQQSYLTTAAVGSITLDDTTTFGFYGWQGAHSSDSWVDNLSVNYVYVTPSAVPGAGLAGLASLGLAGLARRRRR